MSAAVMTRFFIVSARAYADVVRSVRVMRALYYLVKLRRESGGIYRAQNANKHRNNRNSGCQVLRVNTAVARWK
jgi:hypothetical protein